MDLISGLPAHPLIVHLPVVLIPLALVAALVGVARDRWRTPALIVATILVFAGFVGAFLAEESGEQLERRVDESSALEAHAQQGERVPLVAGLFFVVTAGAAAASILSERWDSADATSPEAGRRRSQMRVAGLVLGIGSVAAGVAANVVTFDAGHSGAKAVWEKTAKKQPRAESEEEEREGPEGEEGGEG